MFIFSQVEGSNGSGYKRPGGGRKKYSKKVVGGLDKHAIVG
jgi:hypothetical protein